MLCSPTHPPPPHPPPTLHKLLSSNALGKIHCSQEHLKTMVYAKFGGQTECIMGDLKIENSYFLKLKFVHFLEWEGKAP